MFPNAVSRKGTASTHRCPGKRLEAQRLCCLYMIRNSPGYHCPATGPPRRISCRKDTVCRHCWGCSRFQSTRTRCHADNRHHAPAWTSAYSNPSGMRWGRLGIDHHLSHLFRFHKVNIVHVRRVSSRGDRCLQRALGCIVHLLDIQSNCCHRLFPRNHTGSTCWWIHLQSCLLHCMFLRRRLWGSNQGFRTWEFR